MFHKQFFKIKDFLSNFLPTYFLFSFNPRPESLTLQVIFFNFFYCATLTHRPQPTLLLLTLEFFCVRSFSSHPCHNFFNRKKLSSLHASSTFSFLPCHFSKCIHIFWNLFCRSYRNFFRSFFSSSYIEDVSRDRWMVGMAKNIKEKILPQAKMRMRFFCIFSDFYFPFYFSLTSFFQT